MEAIDATFNIQAILCRTVLPICPILIIITFQRFNVQNIYTPRVVESMVFERKCLFSSVNINASLYRIIYVIQTLFFNHCNYLYCYYV